MKLDKKRIIVTGAASGVGRALLAELATRDVQIIAADRDKDGLFASLAQASQTAGYSQATVSGLVCDLARPEQVDALFEFALTEMSGIDLFVANAGFGYAERIGRPGWDRLAEIFGTNTLSPIYALQKMLELRDPSEFRFVITSSVLGRVALEGWAFYAATKAALDRFVEAFRLEQAGTDPLVVVYPGPIASGFFRAAGGAPQPWLAQSPETVARAVIRGLEKERKTIYTSWLLRPMLLMDRLFPPARRVYQAQDSRIFRRWWAAQRAQQNGTDDQGSPPVSESGRWRQEAPTRTRRITET
jgi:NAD(P)-dependent dehydrogenase (short-subunit alcohol dehydrogenase family)